MREVRDDDHIWSLGEICQVCGAQGLNINMGIGMRMGMGMGMGMRMRIGIRGMRKLCTDNGGGGVPVSTGNTLPVLSRYGCKL